jgi:hypothetical protein
VTPWITLASAIVATGEQQLTEQLLDSAAVEILDEMRWSPVYGSLATLKESALGRAIAWQAAYRVTQAGQADDAEGTRVTSEKIGDYSVSYDGSAMTGGLISNRARALLRQYGLYRMSGLSHAGMPLARAVANAADVLSDP